MLRRSMTVLCALSMVFLGAGAAWANTYSLTDITPTGGWNCDIANTGGNAVTDNGDVAGWANTAGTNYRPFLYTSGTTTNLWTAGNQARAYGIANVSGVLEVAGEVFTPPYSPLINIGGTSTKLAAVGGNSQFYAIDSYGEVGGYLVSSVNHPALYSGGTNGTWTDLNTMVGLTYPSSTLNSGSTVGVFALSPSSTSTSGVAVGGINCSVGSPTPTPTNYSWLWNYSISGSTVTGTYVDIGSGCAYGVNNSSQVVGQTGGSQAYLYSSGTVNLLPLLGSGTQSSARGINNSGDVVGWSDTNGTSTPHAFLYSGGVMTDLNTLPIVAQAGWTSLNWAMAVSSGTNGVEYITGEGTISGANHGFLLAITVPEPSTFALVAAGLIGLLAYAWRKRK